MKIDGWKMTAFRLWGPAYVQGRNLLLVSGSVIAGWWFEKAEWVVIDGNATKLGAAGYDFGAPSS